MLTGAAAYDLSVRAPRRWRGPDNLVHMTRIEENKSALRWFKHADNGPCLETKGTRLWINRVTVCGAHVLASGEDELGVEIFDLVALVTCLGCLGG